tara:strand:+ start:213 stop:359 length:147 start_codon:yes stop_codon:yes gene_type:complete
MGRTFPVSQDDYKYTAQAGTTKEEVFGTTAHKLTGIGLHQKTCRTPAM